MPAFRPIGVPSGTGLQSRPRIPACSRYLPEAANIGEQMTDSRRRDASRRPPYDGAPGAAARPRQRDAGQNGDPRRRASSSGDAYRLPRAARDDRPRQAQPRDWYPGQAPRDGFPGQPAARDEYPRQRDGYPARGPAAGRRPQSPSSGRPRRLWGALPGRTGVCIVVGSAAVGALLTALARSEPGAVLGVFLVAGTLVAALAVKPGAVYRIIPVPALSYLVAAVLAGMIHDRANGTSSTALAVGATQWIASGFVAMTIATILATVIAVIRWGARRASASRATDDSLSAADGGPGRPESRGAFPSRGTPPPRTRPRDEDDYYRGYRASTTARRPRGGQRRG